MFFVRLFLIAYVRMCLVICSTDPNLGREMGRCEGDKRNRAGNQHINMWRKILHQLLIAVLELYSLWMYADVSVPLISYIFAVFAGAGVVFRLWAYRELGHLYTFSIGIRKDHHIVQTGPYALLAHPAYAGSLVTLISAFILYRPSSVIALPLVVYTFYMHVTRIGAEEQMLREHFGDEYERFLASRSRLIPYVY